MKFETSMIKFMFNVFNNDITHVSWKVSIFPKLLASLKPLTCHLLQFMTWMQIISANHLINILLWCMLAHVSAVVCHDFLPDHFQGRIVTVFYAITSAINLWHKFVNPKNWTMLKYNTESIFIWEQFWGLNIASHVLTPP